MIPKTLPLAATVFVLAGCTAITMSCLPASTADSAVPATLDRLRANVHAGKITDADLQQLGKIIEDDPKDAEAHALLGQCLDTVGMRDLAREQYEVANSLDPQRSVGVLEKFKLQVNNGDPADALNNWVQIRKKYPTVPEVAAYEEAIARVYGTVSTAEQASLGEQAHGHNLRGVDSMLSVMESKKGNYARALRLSDLELRKNQTDDCLLAKAMALNGLKKYQAARFVAKLGFRHNILYPGAGQQLAIASVGYGDYKSALVPAMVNAAIWVAPESAKPAADLLATVLTNCSDADIDNALKSDPVKVVLRSEHGPRFNNYLAKSLYAAHKTARAEKQMIDSVNSKILDAQGYADAGKYFENKHTFAPALLMYETALGMDPGNRNFLAAQQCLVMRTLNRQNDLALRLKEALLAR